MQLLNLAALLCALPTVSGQAAKYAATWSNNPITIMPGVDGAEGTSATELLARIKPPGGKTLQITLSGEITILTQTEVRAKNKGPEVSAEAMAGVVTRVVYAPQFTPDMCTDTANGDILTAVPGAVTLAARTQELTAELDLDCDITGEGAEALSCDITGEVAIGLNIETTAAHSFQFLAVNVPAGVTYDVVACFDLSASFDAADEDSIADALVSVRNRIVTIQQVRPATGGIVDASNA